MRILNIFDTLMPSGAEIMWYNAAPYFKREGGDHIILGSQKEIGPFADKLGEKFEIVHRPIGKNYRGMLTIAKAIKTTKADVIHCHSEGRALPSALAGLLTRRPVVRTYHNVWDWVHPKHALKRRLEANLVTRIAVGESVRNTEARWGKVDLVWNWVQVLDGQPVELQPFREPLRLVTVCNTNRTKRCDLMIDLALRDPSVDLTHIGHDKLGVFEPERLKELGIASRVRSLGPSRTVLEQLRDYDVFVCTSDNEGLGIAMLEGFLSGLALAIVDRPGVRDIRNFDPDAFMIDLESSTPLSGLRQSASIQRKAFLANRSTLVDFFSAERGAKEYSDVYRTAIASSAKTNATSTSRTGQAVTSVKR